VPTNQQRRDAERRRLQNQLEQRRVKEAARRRFTLIASIVTTLVVIAAVVVVIVIATNGSGDNKNKAGGASSSPTPTPSASSSPSATPSSSAAAQLPPAPTQPCAAPPKKATASFQGVTVGQAKNIAHAPKVSAKGTAAVSNLLCDDLVVGKGKAASPSSTVTVQYTGVLYKDGKQFDSSWTRGQPAQFPLNQVVPGFTEGIGGAGRVAPMKVGGRRIMILPASLGYGAQANGPIPANSTLVFVVDLKSIDG
jgi:peptidylprolyl isomerase